MLRRIVAIALTASLGAFTLITGPAAAASSSRYIVVLREGSAAPSVAAEHSRRYGAQVTQVYEHALKGYAASVSSAGIGSVRSDPRVAYVEPDRIATANTIQTPVTWGLDRIDQANLPVDKRFNYTKTGAGVNAYIIDTGIDFAHPEFSGRATSGPDYVGNGAGVADNDASDCDGHGTHVAGTVGGKTYGVAKGVSLVAVRVLDCAGSGYWSWVIKGIDWVTSERAKAPATPLIANMSLGGPASTAVDDAVRKSISSGVGFAIAAGNNNRNACDFSPARVQEAMTIGASTSSDAKASFSNHGSCVDWYAPGAGITSSTMGGGTASWNGTSMASPHTAGVAALYLEGTVGKTAAAVRSDLYTISTKNRIKESRKVWKPLLFTNF